MALTDDEDRRLQGIEIYGNDGQKIGIAANPGGPVFEIEVGTLFAKAFYLPKEVIAHVDQTRAYLRISKQEAEQMGREESPGGENPWATQVTPEEPAAGNE